MDYQDKLFEQIKEAERNAENQDFPAMEKVWSRLEEKLDKKETIIDFSLNGIRAQRLPSLIER